MCAQRRFSDLSSTARPARAFAVAAIADGLPRAEASLVDDCELLVAELTANAVQASAKIADAKHIDLTIELHHDHVALAVIDDARGWPILHAPSPNAVGGRGLRLVAALSSQWGVTIGEDHRTIVWAHLTCDTLATAGVPCRFRSPP